LNFDLAQALNRQLNQLKENKDANVQAGDPSSNLKEQLQDLKAHHTAAVDLFVRIQYRLLFLRIQIASFCFPT